MKGVDAARHQAVSTWAIEVLTVTLAAIASYQFARTELSLSPFSAILVPALLLVSIAALREMFKYRVFGGVS